MHNEECLDGGYKMTQNFLVRYLQERFISHVSSSLGPYRARGGTLPTNIRGRAAGKSKKLPFPGVKFPKMIPCPGVKFS